MYRWGKKCFPDTTKHVSALGSGPVDISRDINAAILAAKLGGAGYEVGFGEMRSAGSCCHDLLLLMLDNDNSLVLLSSCEIIMIFIILLMN
jgi:hypothetical protein